MQQQQQQQHQQEKELDALNSELEQQLSLESQKAANNDNNIPNCARVMSSYSAITEDEISVQKGDVVQIITANMHNRFLVHREANEQQPAAEGWIPGFVIGFQSTSLINPWRLVSVFNLLFLEVIYCK